MRNLVTVLAAVLVTGCSTLLERKPDGAKPRALLGDVSMPLCLFWCSVNANVTDGEAGATVKGATISQTETVSTSVNKPEAKQ